MKSTWLVLTLSCAGIAFSMEVPVKERQSFKNWTKRRGLRLIGEFTSYSTASRAVQRWTAVHRRNFEIERFFNPVNPNARFTFWHI